MLTEPLTEAQVHAASRLHSRLVQWEAADAALDRLGAGFPDFDLQSTLLKVVAVDHLYATNIVMSLPAAAMAQHIVSIMKTPPAGAALVEAIAAIEDRSGARKHLRSFASKFCHFFVEPRDRYPIFDKYVGLSLRHHLGKAFPFDDASNPPPYHKVLAALDDLRKFGALSCKSRELDQYLWLSGLYREWRRKENAKINVEVGDMFRGAEKDAAVKADLVAMS